MTNNDAIEDIYELTPMQQGMLFHSLVNPTHAMYVEQLSCEVKGEVDVDKWRAAWTLVLQRHPILRTGFMWEGLEKPLQVVVNDAVLPWHLEDLRALSESEQEERLERYLVADREKGFVLDQAPLVRCALFRLSDDRRRFLWTYHHLLLDGWCFSIVLREVLEVLEVGPEALPPPPRPYRDYIAWLQGQDPKQAEAFWRTNLKGFEEPTPLPLAERHADVRPEEEPVFAARRLSVDLTERLTRFAQQQRVTVNNMVQAAWSLVLARASDKSDVAFGVTVSGRPAELDGSEGIVGLFINTVPMRAQVEDAATPAAFLKSVQAQHLNIDSYGYGSLADVQSWSEAPHDRPLFETLLVYENVPLDRASLQQRRTLEIGGVKTRGRTNYPVTVIVIPAHAGESLELRLLLDRSCYVEKTGERLLALIESTLIALLTVKTLGEITIVDQAAKVVLSEWSANPKSFPESAPVPALIKEHAKRAPEAIALVGPLGQKISYRELELRASQVAAALVPIIAKRREALVAVCIERSIEYVVALYGVMKAGAAYLPLDPAYPKDRLDFIAGDAKPVAIVTAGADPIAHREIPRLNLHRLPAGGDAPLRAVEVDELAYVIYTSGSTGNPKGVEVTHRTLLNLIAWHLDAFGVTERDRTTHLASVAFDASAWEIWPALAAGACVDIVPPELVASPPDLLGYLVERKINVSFLPTPVAEAVLALDWPKDTALRFLLTGGDRLHAYAPSGAPFQLVNNYGPTETTVVATSGIVGAPVRGGLPSIGRPIANARIYLLDRAKRPVPPGVVGEVFIGGAGVARGYLNRPELTKERFVPDPFSDVPGARMYASGDLASFHADGTIDFHGRRDRQVQVRGVRIEPGEIEAALASHEAISAAAVVSEDQKANGDVRLIAFAAAREGRAPIEAAALTAFAKTKLPPAAIPAKIIIVDALPMTPNGKVDYLELLARAKASAAETRYTPPKTPHEEVLVGIFSAVLGKERIGTSDDFFEIGGHSLKATQVVARAREAFGVELPIRMVFEQRTVAAIARAIAGQAKSFEPIPRIDPAGELPLAPGQESLWFIDALGGDTTAYNVPMMLRLRGRLDVAILRRTIELLVDRHEALRTVFEEKKGKPVQKIRPRPAHVLSHEHIDAAVLEKRIAEEVSAPFSLSEGPLFRAHLFEVSSLEHVLVLNQHHIIIDAWSLTVMLRELCTIYATLCAGGEPLLPELPIRYADWAAWQRKRLDGGALEAGLAAWKKALAGVPEALALPTDRERPAKQSFRGKTKPFALAAPYGDQLEAIAKSEGASIFMTALAAFAAYLSRISGQEDLVIGTPAANRDRAETENLAGYFLNTLALRIDLSGDPTFTELLHRVRKVALDAYAHQDVPFETVVAALGAKRDLAHNPLFQVMFTIQGQSGGKIVLPSLEVEVPNTDHATSKFDLTLFAEPKDGAVLMSLEYSTDLFDDDRIERMTAQLLRVLELVAGDPAVHLSELVLLSGDEKRALAAFNATRQDFRDRTLVELFSEQAKKTPEAIALEHGDAKKSYAALAHDAGALADRLAALGVGPDVPVAICLARSIDAWTAMLAVLEAGGAYVPLDPSYPEERLRFMLEDSRARVLITDAAHEALFASSATPRMLIDRVAAASAAPRIVRGLLPDHLAYVLYTSGSTGKPKGVAMPHRALVNLIEWQRGQVEVGRTLQFAPLSFDVSFQETFSTWCGGGTLVLVDEETRRDPDALVALLARARIERLFLPAVALHHLAQAALHAGASLPHLSAVITAGDQLRITEPVRRFMKSAKRKLHNHYGPTESHVVTAHVLDGDPELWPGLPPIGKPIANSAVHVLDAHRRPLPIGVPGELYLAGACLARGYLARAELTAERFVDLSGETAGRAYRTGDLGRWRADGTLEFLGRADDQVKIRGFRVEPGEVERALCAHPKVKDAAIVVDSEGGREKRLVAYVVTEDDQAGTVEKLRSFLARDLPEYMVPALFVPMPALPRTPSGKVDRRSLPAPSSIAKEAAAPADERPKTPLEANVARIFSEVLARDHVGLEQSFFELGGHSLLAMQIVARLRDALSVELRVAELFANPTVASLARILEDKQKLDQTFGRKPIERAPAGATIPLSFSQERLWFLEELHPGSPAYNLPMALRLKGSLDVALVKRALGEIVRRHPVLSKKFVENDGQLAQVPSDAIAGAFEIVDAANMSEAELSARVREEAARPFELAKGPLIRARLFVLSAHDHLIVTTMHHAVSDGWSISVLMRELSALYLGQTLPDLPIDYLDFAYQQRKQLAGAAYEARLDFWRKHLTGAPEALNMPADRPRPPKPTLRGSYARVAFAKELSEKLEALSRRANATPFMVLLAAFTAYLARITGQEDIVVGTPIANRERPELEALIGFFVGTLPIRVDLTGNPSFDELLARVRGVALDAYAHQDVPLEQIVEAVHPERNLSHAPLFQVMLVVQNTPPAHLDLPGLKAEMLELDIGIAKADLSLVVERTPQGFGGALEYSTDLFDADRIERMIAHLTTLLSDAIAHPEKRVYELELMPASERELLWSLGQGKRMPPPELPLFRMFEVYAEKNPQAIAVEYRGTTLSYGELNARANRVAHRLIAHGAGPEKLVLLSVLRSFELIIGIFAIWKAGAAYVPLDPAYPKARLDDIVEDTGSQLMVSTRATAARWSTTKAEIVWLDESFALEPATNPARAVSLDDPAYVIYTSGSTGRPKGVVLEQRGLANVPLIQREGMAIDGPTTVLQFASINFDASVFELALAYGHGGRLVLVSSETLLAGDELRDAMIDHHVTDVILPPTSLAALPRDRAFPALRRLVSGGEACSADVVKKWARDGVRFFNAYGPTEATILCTITECDPKETGAPPIGRPVVNFETRVLDARGRLLPIGVPGELYIGGIGVGRGYWKRDELTKEKFVTLDFGSAAAISGRAHYRSGDLTRVRKDGQIEYLGRIDNQVKLRGFRIELGEIEAVIGERPEVQQAHVAVFGEGARTMLVGYVVLRAPNAVSVQQIREHAKTRLPEYMVPSELILLEALPMTANGKIDRKKLPPPRLEGAEDRAAFVEPKTREEQILAQIWAPLLARERIGVHDDFFALGGHSLLAAQMISRVRKTFGVDIALSAIFEHSTLGALAAAIAEREQGDALPALVRSPDAGGDRPLSFAQERLRFLAELQGESAAYNIPVALRVNGPVSIEALSKSLGTLLERHEALRMIFPLAGGAPVARVVDTPASLTVERAGANWEARVREESARPFALATGPLLRAFLFEVSPLDHVLLVVMHHIISDGWSMGVLIRELSSLYAAFARGESLRLPELPIQYSDYARWQRAWLEGQVRDRQLAYWKNALKGAPRVLDLPTDRPRPISRSHKGAIEELALSLEASRALETFAREQGVTIYMALIAAFGAYLGRISGQDDLVLGSPFAGRRLAETEGLIGFFVNTLPMRIDLYGDPSFVELVSRVKSRVLGAHEHQDVPFERLVEELHPERQLGTTPIFQVMFALQPPQSAAKLELPGLTIEPIAADSATSKFDLTLSLAETERGLRGAFEYDIELFDRWRVQAMARHFKAFVERIVVDPSARVGDVDFLGAEERARLLPRPAARGEDVPCVHETVARFARTTPKAIAVAGEAGSLSYAELDQRAERLAAQLVARGVEADVLVGIALERSLEMIVAVLGVLKSGAAYVPLDPNYPPERLAFMVKDAGARVVITRRSHAPLFPDASLLFIGEESSSESAGNRRDLASSLAYCIYTSGSTGRPKGVLIEHAMIARHMKWEIEAMQMKSSDRVLQIASLSFDASVWEIFLALTSGATLVLAPADLGADVDRLARFMRDQKTTIALIVPSMVSMLIDAPAFKEITSMRRYCPGAEALPSAVVKRLFQSSNAEVWNVYGPTECTIIATAHACTAESVGKYGPTEPIGRPITGMQALVLDHRLRPVPDGVPGELYLEGATLARGYKDRPELDAERFPVHTFENGVRLRLYKTGDVVFRNTEGALVFVGRADRQVKVRGFRIELGEIEAAIARQPGVREAAAVVVGEGAGAQLVAFVVSRDDRKDSMALRNELAKELAAHMVPGHVVWLDSLPRAPSGKIDHRTLSQTKLTVERARPEALPRDPSELEVVRLFEETLGRKGVGIYDSFFELGGHSLLALKLKLGLEQAFGRPVALVSLFQNPTPEQMAAMMREGAADKEPSPLVPLNASAQARLSSRTASAKPAFFVVPGGASTPFYFLGLARELAGIDVFGLQPKGLDGEAPPHERVEDYAAWYRQAIVSIQSEGPYYLGGHSFGGQVVYEVAQQLLERGQKIGTVALFDTIAPFPEATRPIGAGFDSAEWLVHIAKTMETFFLAKVGLDAAALRKMSETERLEHAVARMTAGGILPAGATPSHVLGILNVTRAQDGTAYRPQRMEPLPLVVFRAKEKGESKDKTLDKLVGDDTLGWSSLLGAEVVAHESPGSHLTLVREPHVVALAAILRGYVPLK